MLLVYAVAGLLVGSFLNVMMDRLPARQSLLRPPSHCPACERRLSPWEMIPVFSYLGLRGRCRTCGAVIPIRVLLVELASGVLFALLWWAYGPSLRLVLTTIYACLLMVALVTDLEHRKILNVTTFPSILLALAALPLQWLMMPPPHWQIAGFGTFVLRQWPSLSPPVISMLSMLLGGLVGFGVFFLLCVIPWRGQQAMGEGDVKLAAFIGLITGLPGVLMAIYLSWILGGVVAIVLLLLRRVKINAYIPYGPSLVIPTLAILLYGDRILSLFRSLFIRS